jgi:coenzyme F420-reducing hydrogenase gamma subunit
LNKTASIGFGRKPPEHAAAAEQVRAWTRARFGLPEDAVIMVAEVTCAVPGCPPLETVIAFWVEATRHHFKVFKPVAEVAEDDLPPAWLKNALADQDGIGCECC